MPDISDNDRKCALYVRVSTVNQAEDGESLDEQVHTLNSYCSYRKWQYCTVYREEGFSGKDLKRPAFQQMLADIQKGKINTVIVKKVDRLSRSIIDFENVYKSFQDKGVDLISTQENFDTSTAIGRSVIRIVLIFAQLEREQTSERTIDVMAHRAKQGLFNGGYPRLGYDIDYENKCLVPNESEIPIVNDIFSTYLRLGSLSATAMELHEKGYRLKTWTTKAGRTRGGEKFHKTNVSRMLNDPVYVGKVKYKSGVYDGQHQGIVSEELYEAVQSILQANNISKTGYRQMENMFYLKGLVRCGSCRSAMAPSFAYSKGNKYFYYRCTVNNDRSKNQCRIGSVHAAKLEGLVIDELKFLAGDPRIIEGVVEKATKDKRKKSKELAAKKKVLSDNLALIENKARNLLEVLGGNGKRNNNSGFIVKELDELDLQAGQLRNEIEGIELEANDLENKIMSADLIRDNFKVLKDVYDHLTPDEKYDLLHLLVKKVVYFEEPEADKDGKKTGKIKMDLWELPPIDPSKLSPAKGFAERNVWLPSADSNHGHGG
jgi:site-specific DNA recombinase